MSLSLSHRLLKGAIRFFEKVFKGYSNEFYLKIAAEVVNELDLSYTVKTKNASVTIKCLSETVRIRARDMLIREPDTLEWIDQFNGNDVFWDVGANIGVFTLYAAAEKRVKTVSFDPLPHNYHALVENIALNNFTGLVSPYCIAISDDVGSSNLYVPDISNTAGGAGCPFGDNVDNYGESVETKITIPALGYSIDRFIETFQPPFPTHLKIDIDGIQEKVIIGAKKTLRDERLQSIMIELQPNKIPFQKKANEFILKELSEAGFERFKIVGATQNMNDDPENSVTNNFFQRKT